MGAEPFSESTKRIFELAQTEASMLAHGYVSVEHLLLAMLRNHSDPITRLLMDLSIRPQQLCYH